MDEPEYPNDLCDRRPASSIATHLIESGRKVNIGEALYVLFKSNNGKLLRFIETAIKKFNPDLGIQKKIHSLPTIALVAWDITYWFRLFED